MRVGIAGCGVISRQYARNAPAFDAFEIVACADLMPEAAEALAAEFGYAALPVDELIAGGAVDIVLNLTPPPVHVDLVREALAAGKHVYSEKPLAITVDEAGELVEEAERRGLCLGCAPDTFLGGPYQTARALIDEGAIGQPLSVNGTMLAGGQSSWHPNPDIFYADGAGPLLDMGPYYLTAIVSLLGPVRRVAGFASTRVSERAIEIGPRAGERFVAHTPTHTSALLELEGGVTGSLVASFEAPDQYVGELFVDGSTGSLALPDPNGFAGPVRLRNGRDGWRDVPHGARGGRDARGIGLQDLVESILEGRAPRASGRLAHHVVDVARSVLAAAEQGRTLDVGTRVDRPAALPVGIAAPLQARFGSSG
jgi:predicted dehydrogenase